ncbi:hypothetical protein VTG60DRAFT_5069 [Thermothelomyces hinnuleus]
MPNPGSAFQQSSALRNSVVSHWAANLLVARTGRRQSSPAFDRRLCPLFALALAPNYATISRPISSNEQPRQGATREQCEVCQQYGNNPETHLASPS